MTRLAMLYALQLAKGHAYPGHVECPERLLAIERALESSGLTERMTRVRRCRYLCVPFKMLLAAFFHALEPISICTLHSIHAGGGRAAQL